MRTLTGRCRDDDEAKENDSLSAINDFVLCFQVLNCDLVEVFLFTFIFQIQTEVVIVVTC